MAEGTGKRKHQPAGPVKPSVSAPASGVAGTKHLVLLLFLAVVLVNANTLTNGWALDDTLLITQNKITQQGFSAIPEIWSNDVFMGYFGKGGIEAGGRYRPLSQTVFAMEYSLVGPKPFLGHFINVLLYAFTCVLLLRLLVRIFPESGSRPVWNNIPFLATAFYALHPLHVEVVANIKSLDEILAMLFALLATLFALRSLNEHRGRNILFSALCFFLALTAKENAITFLAVIPLALYFTTRDPKRILFTTAALLVPAALYFLLRSVALGPAPDIAWEDNFLTNPFHGASPPERVATVLLIFWKYITLMFVPTPLTTDYYPGMIPVVGWGDFRVWLGLVVLTVVVVVALMGLRKKSVAGFGALYFLITFSVVSNLLINLGTPLNDRFLFVPLAGFTLLLAWSLTEGLGMVRSSWTVVTGRVLIVVILAGYAGKTFSRNGDWKDDLTLFSHDILVSGKSARCNAMFGKLCYEAAVDAKDRATKKRYQADAQRYLSRGLEIYDGYFLAWGMLGVLEMDRQNYRKSAENFIRCLEIEPRQDVALKNLGFVGRQMFEAQDHPGAERALKAFNHFDSTEVDPYLFLADIYMRSGRADSSIVLLDKMLRSHPGGADGYRMKGEIQATYLGDPVTAEQNFLKAHELDPKNVSVIDNLGVGAFQRRDYEQALKYFLKAVETGPGNAHQLVMVARTYAAMGNEAKAREYQLRSEEAERSAANK